MSTTLDFNMSFNLEVVNFLRLELIWPKRWYVERRKPIMCFERRHDPEELSSFCFKVNIVGF